MSASFYILYLISSALIVGTIFFTKKPTLVLLIVILQNVFIVSLTPLIYLFGIQRPYGFDECQYLGITRMRLFEYERVPIVYQPKIRVGPEELPYSPKVAYDIFHSLFHMALISTISKAFTLDVYWVSCLFPIILSNIVVPFIIYRLTAELRPNVKAALLSAMLVLAIPGVAWMFGRGTPQITSTVFFIYAFYASIKYFQTRDRNMAVLGMFSVMASLLSHYLVGALSAIVMMIAILISIFQSLPVSRRRALLEFGASLVPGLMLPALFILRPYFFYYAVEASVELDIEGMLHSFLGLGFAGKTSYFSPLIVFVAVSYLQLVRTLVKPCGITRTKKVVVLTSFAIWTTYSVTANLSNGALYAERVPMYFALITLPLVVDTFSDLGAAIGRYMDRRFGAPTLVLFLKLTKTKTVKMALSGTTTKSFASALCLILFIPPALAYGYWYTFERNDTYPQRAFPLTSRLDTHVAKELDALSNGSYVVLSDRTFLESGTAYFGYSSTHGHYNDWNPTTTELFSRFLKDETSLDDIQDLLNSTNSEVAYIVVSRSRYPSFNHSSLQTQCETIVYRIPEVDDEIVVLRILTR